MVSTMTYDPQPYWDNRRVDTSHPAPDLVAKVQAALGALSFDSVIEVGCGSGVWSPFFTHYTGYDFSPTRLAIARERYPHTRFLDGDLLQGITQKADLVFTHKVLLHIPPKDITRAIANLRKIAPKMVLVEPATNRNGYQAEHVFYHNYLALIKDLTLFSVYPMEEEDTGIFISP